MPRFTGIQEQELVDRCLIGDTAAWQTLHDHYSPALRRHIKWRLAKQGTDTHLIEDLVQDVWELLLAANMKRLHAFNGCRARLSTYLRALALQAIRKEFRTQNRRPKVECVLHEIAPLCDFSAYPSPQTVWLMEVQNALTPSMENFLLVHHLGVQVIPSDAAAITSAAVWQWSRRLRAVVERVVGWNSI